MRENPEFIGVNSWFRDPSTPLRAYFLEKA